MNALGYTSGCKKTTLEISEILMGSHTCFPLQAGMQGDHLEQLLPTLILLALILHPASWLSPKARKSPPPSETVKPRRNGLPQPGGWPSTDNCPEPQAGCLQAPRSMELQFSPCLCKKGSQMLSEGLVRLQRSQNYPPSVPAIPTEGIT